MRGVSQVLAFTLICLATGGALGQSPEAALQSLPQEQQAWVIESCPRALGPSLWLSCINREVRALRGGMPDLSKLTDRDRNWIVRSCPSSLGPSIAIGCLTRELNALNAGVPNLEQLPADRRAWVQQTCPQSLGPSIYRSCAEREVRALLSSASSPRPYAAPATGQAVPNATPRVSSGRRAGAYTIETSHNDELFIINGEKFEAKTFCFNMEEGDAVVFLDGSPYGACASATLLNLRTRQKCATWCE